MRTILRQLIFAGLVLTTPYARAQYLGGAGGGISLATLTSATLGTNIFKGGTDDGNSATTATAQRLGTNIFLGGKDDGQATITATAQPLGTNIFLGGRDDGQATITATAQSLGINIFLGGKDDGQATTLATAKTLGQNIFFGGANDGWAMAIPSAVNLPITLSTFTGQWQQNDALLLWQTMTETNSDRFQLQRSYDGSTFTPVGTVAAAGESNTPRDYQYIDQDVKTAMQTQNKETVYYRLRSIDKDGKDAYSGIVILHTELNGGLTYAVFPNPARDVVNITVKGGIIAEETQAYLYDVGGRLLQQIQINNNTRQLSVYHYASGVYFLQLVTAGKVVYTQKIIIQK